jgi:hypothetical protein
MLWLQAPDAKAPGVVDGGGNSFLSVQGNLVHFIRGGKERRSGCIVLRENNDWRSSAAQVVLPYRVVRR